MESGKVDMQTPGLDGSYTTGPSTKNDMSGKISRNSLKGSTASMKGSPGGLRHRMFSTESFHDDQEGRMSMSSGVVFRYMKTREEDMEKGTVKQTTWWQTSFIIVACFMGTGSLNMPHSFALVGWIPSVTLIILVGILATYCGLLLSRLGQFLPTAATYADIGRAAMGKFGEYMTMAIIYFHLWGDTIVYHVTCSIALKDASGGSLCYLIATIITAGCTLLLLQVKSLRDLSWISVVGIVTILVPLIIVCIWLIAGGAPAENTTTLFRFNYVDFVRTLSSFIFSYLGQKIFIDLMSEMKEPKTFPWAVYSGMTILALSYMTLGCVGYYYGGADVASPITSELSGQAVLSAAMNILLFLHVMIAYVINGNVLIRGMLIYLPWDRCCAKTGPGLRWFISTVMVVTCSFLIANVFPSFDSLMSLLGAFTGMGQMVILPTLFTVCLLKAHISKVEFYLNYALLILGTLFMITATITLGYFIIQDFELGQVFAC